MDEFVRWIESQLLQTGGELSLSKTRPKLWALLSKESVQALLDWLAVSVFTRSSLWVALGMAGRSQQTIPKSRGLRLWFDSTAKIGRQVNSITTDILHCWTTFRLPFWMLSC